MKRVTTLLAAAVISAGALLSTSATAEAADCPSGFFCVWTDADFEGLRVEYSGDDNWWEANISQDDSSWANHALSGPGIKDHVKVYAGRGLEGPVTLCLAPGQEVAYNASANDKGASHTFTSGC